jgi:hypothetical protein
MSAPSSPTTYEQALTAAAAIQAVRSAPADPVTVLATMSDQIISKRQQVADWAKAQIHRLWLSVNPYNQAQVQAFAVQAAGIMASAQTVAARTAAAGQAQQLAALGIAVNGAPSNPLDVRAPTATIKAGQLVLHRHGVSVDYAGPGTDQTVSPADMTTQAIFTRPAAVFRYAQSQGSTDAAALSGQRINSLVDDNLMLAQRLAQQQVLVQAINLDTGKTRSGLKVTGYRRVIHPERSKTGTCGMCIVASDRVYHVAKLMPIHGGCWCTISAVTEDHDPGDDLNSIDIGQLYKHAGGNTAAHLKRTRYQIDDHGELGPTLVPQKPYKPRTPASKKPAGKR